MSRVSLLFFRFLDVVLVVLLSTMTVMVFANVVLRYLFGSGIQLSEELSRFLFVWLTFIGAVVASRHGLHLGMETLVSWLGERGRLVCIVLTDLCVVLCSAVFFWGTWQQAEINATFYAPVTGLSMLWVYGIGFFTSTGMIGIALERLARVLTGRLRQEELDAFAGHFEADAAAVKERLE